jgi:chemotaxis protein methyltransferase CheR
MKDPECVALLRSSVARLGLSWQGFRNVHGQVCKRIRRRVVELGLAELAAYQELLEREPSEWLELERLCAVTISRFYRDALMWQRLRDELLPALARAARARGQDTLRCWSIGCASGEEPYTLAIVWALELAARYPELRLRILATDIGEPVLARARAARYSAATLSELPEPLRARAFLREGGLFRLRDELRAAVELRCSDLRRELPEERFQLLLCRNNVFTYFGEAEQRSALERLSTRLLPGGALVLGRGESLPAGAALDAIILASEPPPRQRAGWRCLPRTPA